MTSIAGFLFFLSGFAVLSINLNMPEAASIVITLITPIPIILIFAFYLWSIFADHEEFRGFGGKLLIGMFSVLGYFLLGALLCYFQQDYQPIALLCSFLPGI